MKRQIDKIVIEIGSLTDLYIVLGGNDLASDDDQYKFLGEDVNEDGEGGNIAFVNAEVRSSPADLNSPLCFTYLSLGRHGSTYSGGITLVAEPEKSFPLLG
jgi:hypothetical protein